MIPNEAVEAAARAHLDARGEAIWDDLTQVGRHNRLYWMRAALEAALPLLKDTK